MSGRFHTDPNKQTESTDTEHPLSRLVAINGCRILHLFRCRGTFHCAEYENQLDQRLTLRHNILNAQNIEAIISHAPLQQYFHHSVSNILKIATQWCMILFPEETQFNK
ncbi:hypothetical protein AMECASPLE_036938 [Ameca splendens]|uniref:Uncharacterized protein n=1 Tax=Ameca splendens TaxID=208324 RepID=A0ABV0YK15_9TELE